MANNIELDIAKFIDDISKTVNEQLNKGLDNAAEKYLSALSENSPSSKRNRNKYKSSWKVSRRYHNMRIIHNTKKVDSPNGKIPLVNILEPEGRFAQDLLEKMRPELTDIILNELKLD